MREAYIVEAVRSPMGRGRQAGALAPVHPVDLLAQVLQALVERTGVDPGEIDDVIVGCVSQVGEQSATPGRMAVLAAGFPSHVPAVTIDRKCGSSQQAVEFGANAIVAGSYDIVIAAGVESMSRIPMGTARLDMDPFGPMVNERFAPGLVPQGISAELVAAKWGLSRLELDRYAVRSHRLAAAAASSGAFHDEIVPITRPDGSVVDADETIRPDSSEEALGQLGAAFDAPPWRERFPELSFHMTAGNSSQITDGASALLLMSEDAVNRFGLTPRARFRGSAVIGDDPLLMLTAPIPATRNALERAGLALDDIDHFEVNEAFAPVPLAWLEATGAHIDKLNPRGGAIALGHPLGASGSRLMTTMVHALGQTRGRFGLQTMCEAGGMANATIIERV